MELPLPTNTQTMKINKVMTLLEGKVDANDSIMTRRNVKVK